MALIVKWTFQAEKGLYEIIEYLEKEWTVKEVLQLEKKINQVINQIVLNPELYPKSEKNKSLRKVVVDKNNYFVYKLNKKTKLLKLLILEEQNKSQNNSLFNYYVFNFI